ncbi:hypothetical protein WA158_003072 [Blastocystis sp. Blastoise]
MGSCSSKVQIEEDPIDYDAIKSVDYSQKMNYEAYKMHEATLASNNFLKEMEDPSKLFSFPQRILLYKNIEVVIINYQYIPKVPKDIRELTHLKRLVLQHNWYIIAIQKFFLYTNFFNCFYFLNDSNHLPCELSNCVNLRKIDLSHNELQKLHPSISSLIGIEKLNISYNKFKRIPMIIGSLVNLKVLLIHNNPLSSPDSMVLNSSSAQIIVFLKSHVSTEEEVRSEEIDSESEDDHDIKGKTYIHIPIIILILFINVIHLQGIYIYIYSSPQLYPIDVRVSPSFPRDPDSVTGQDVYIGPSDDCKLNKVYLENCVVGYIYGIAVGDAIGLMTRDMTVDEVSYNYSLPLRYDALRITESNLHYIPGDWTCYTDFVLILMNILSSRGHVSATDLYNLLFRGNQVGYHIPRRILHLLRDPHFCEDPITISNTIPDDEECVDLFPVVLTLPLASHGSSLFLCIFIGSLVNSIILQGQMEPNDALYLSTIRLAWSRASKHVTEDQLNDIRKYVEVEKWDCVSNIRIIIESYHTPAVYLPLTIAIYSYIYEGNLLDLINMVCVLGDQACVNTAVVTAIMGAKGGIGSILNTLTYYVNHLPYKNILDRDINLFLNAMTS